MKFVVPLLAAASAFAQVSGVPNFHKVNDLLYRGGQPSRAGFKNLASLGVKTIIDLREVGEHSQADEAFWVKADGMRYVNIPLAGLSAPRDADVAKALALLNDSSAGPVFIHCRRGADRTGTIVACYRIWHDHWQNRQALDEARHLGMSRFELAMQHYILRFSPEAETKTLLAGPN
ncbi:MAG TPA: tyrosine-protein phosphatase [Bryobacteraceae bacterium]|nr:tyrosine-protein phosphatase [Bryobacteraceae bacterium]